MQYLNNYFGGLKDNYPIGFQTGNDFLTRSEVSLNLDAVKEINNTVQGSIAPEAYYDDSAERAAEANSYQDVNRSVARGNDAMGSLYVTVMGNGGQQTQIEYRPDGSEIHTYYNEDGDVSAIGYRSTEYVKEYNDKYSGTAFETTQYKSLASSNASGFINLSAQSSGGGPCNIDQYSQPDPIDMNTASGLQVVQTLVSEFQYQITHGDGTIDMSRFKNIGNENVAITT